MNQHNQPLFGKVCLIQIKETLCGLFFARSEVPNPQMLHQLACKFISKMLNQLETGKVYISIQFKANETILYGRSIVAE